MTFDDAILLVNRLALFIDDEYTEALGIILVELALQRQLAEDRLEMVEDLQEWCKRNHE